MAAESSAGKRRPVSASGAPLTENKRRGRLPDNGKTTSIEAYSQVRILLRRRIARVHGSAAQHVHVDMMHGLLRIVVRVDDHAVTALGDALELGMFMNYLQ